MIEDKAHAYLQENAGYLTDESVAALLAGLEPYNLTVREKLQLINLGPVSEIDIHLVRTDRETATAANAKRCTSTPAF